MSLVNFTNLDFQDIKDSIKEYLRSNSNFTDYDFEGSNLSIILDILAYNTYISSYNANMISNEVFIDSATLRENVVALARNIGYLPRSRTSARAKINFFVDTTGFSTKPVSITLQKGIVCTTSASFGSENYTYVVPEDITVPVVDGVAFFDNNGEGIEIFEGSFINENFTVDNSNANQRFILDNPNIDVSLIRVIVRDSVSSTIKTKYNQSNSLFGLDAESKIYFIQEVEDQRYELIFGDGIFGKKLNTGNYIDVSYVTSGGEGGNGVRDFSFAGRLIDNNGRVVGDGVSIVSTITESTGGSEIESIKSIKNNAPRLYSAQNRAVTASDYEAIIPRIYPEAESVSVFGGEELDPPKYGKVFITIKPTNGQFVPNGVKRNLKNSLRKYSVAGIVPEILDLKYLYIEVNTSAYYNTNLASNAESVFDSIINNINKYADSAELNKYGARFKYSKFQKIIDDSDNSITSNITKIQIRRDLRAAINQLAEYEICYGNEFHIKSMNGYNIKSSGFTVKGIPGTLYLSDIPNSDGRTGSIFFFRLNSDTNSEDITNSTIVRKSIGTIDYVKGEILLNPINILTTSKFNGESIIEISAIPKSNDVIGLQDLYLQLDTTRTVLNMVSDEISSGANPSGSNYTRSSSYINGDLIRK
jgi:hypothetical protein